MRKILFLLISIALFSSSIFAQETRDSEEKKIYRSEDKKLYIQKDLGLYLWISTSPDADAEKVRLKSEQTDKYANPMYLDTEGYNTVRSPSAVDPETKKTIYPLEDIIFEVYADGLPPQSSSNYSYGVTNYLDGKRYYGGDLSISLKSYDKFSGVEAVSYTLNSDTWSSYKDPLTKAVEGENTLRFYSTDHVGNKEEVNEEVFYLDNTPPSTDYKIQGDQNEKFVSANATIKLSSEDKLSGVKAIYYRINKGSFIRYTTPISARLLVGEDASISYYAVDKLNNKEEIEVIGSSEGLQMGNGEENKDVAYEFYVDNKAPEVNIKIEAINDVYKGKYEYVSPRTTFRISASDDKSGVHEIKYNINSSKESLLYKDPFALETAGLQYIHTVATDYVGNSSPEVNKPFFMDNKAPATRITIGSPKFTSRDTLFISSKTSVSLKAADDHSGVKSIEYSPGGGNDVVYDKPFQIDGNGLQKITYQATDQVNNKEEQNEQVIFVDNQAPKIHYHFSVESIGNKVVREDNYTIYPTNAMLYVAATDARAGGEKIEYTINEGSLLTANPIKDLSPGNYLITLYAYDVLGNKSMEVIKFAVEE